MRTPILAVAVALSFVGCESKKPSPEPAPASHPALITRAPLVDLTTASTLSAVRTAFNAHKGEARFLTLLSPT